MALWSASHDEKLAPGVGEISQRPGDPMDGARSQGQLGPKANKNRGQQPRPLIQNLVALLEPRDEDHVCQLITPFPNPAWIAGTDLGEMSRCAESVLPKRAGLSHACHGGGGHRDLC